MDGYGMEITHSYIFIVIPTRRLHSDVHHQDTCQPGWPSLPLRMPSQTHHPPSTISLSMETARIAELLQPFLAGPGGPAVLSPAQLDHISMYIDLLLHWNARINLTSVRQPEAIVTRHFGESLFAARHLFPDCVGTGDSRDCPERSRRVRSSSLIDIGSGAGFPGVPIKLWAPHLHLTLIESNHKKVAFLRQLARTITLTDIDIVPGRAEVYAGPLADLVTLRAVEHFSSAVPTAARLVGPGGRLALLIGQAQVAQATELLPSAAWDAPIPLPLSSSRVLLIGRSRQGSA
jgi:16S rRNA (guanine527-N7)-methyltransferase